MRRILLALALLLGSLGAAEAQVSTCPLTTQAKIVSTSSYTVQTSDKCLLVVLTATGTINVVLPAPGLIFAPGFYTTLFPLNGGTLSMTGMADDAGKLHKINQQNSYVFGAAQGANLSVLQDFNWWGVPTGASGAAGSGTVTSVTFTGDGTVLSSTPSTPVTTTGTLVAALNPQAVKRVLAGPTSGSPATPTFRQLACADLSDAAAGCSSAAGITQLTGDVTSGPGSGSQAATLANTAVTPGSFVAPTVTVDSKGRITAATTTACNNSPFIAFTNCAQTYTASQRGTVQTVAISTATFTPNFDTAQNFSMTLVHASCPCTLANPSTTLVAGQSGMIEIVQSSTGSDTIGTWGSEFIAAGGTSTITLSTVANAKDRIPYYIPDTTHIMLGAPVLNATH